ncbi:MAG: transglycosylase domain-containing protein, partial [Actinomycetota bacterium]
MNSIQTVLDPLSGPMPARNRRRNPFWRFRRLLFVMVLMAVVGAGTVLYVFSQTELPEDRVAELAQTSYLCTAEVTFDCGPDNATAQLSVGGEDREVVTYADLPPQLIAAVVATEDQDFFTHQGIDPRGISRAAYQYFFGSGVVQGGSTITQQYVKLAFNDEDETLTRKAREAIRAIKLEQELAEECDQLPEAERVVMDGVFNAEQCAKQEILIRYLNRAYFGRGASGVQSAAQAYFGKDVGEVTVAESAFLAGLLRNPNGADPEIEPEEANRRRTVSLELMAEAGYLTPAEAQEAAAEAWLVEPRRNREGLGEVEGAEWGSEYFVEEVRLQIDELFPNGEIYTRGLRVYTTLNQDLQRAAYESAHAPKVEDLETRDFPEMGPLFLDPNNPDDPDAAIVSIDHDGRVVAMVGGTDFEESEFNLATSSGTAGRQPGSTFKTLGLALAVEQDISLMSYYPAIPGVTRVGPPCSDGNGQPWQVTGGSSARYRYRDLVDALRWSSNVVFAQLVVQLTPNALADFATEMGVTSDLKDPLANGTSTAPCSLILGGKGVPVIDMAAVYSVFERDGQRLDPVLIERVEDSEGNVLCWYPVNGECSPTDGVRVPVPVIAESTAHQVNYAMTQVVGGGTGRRANIGDHGHRYPHPVGWRALAVHGVPAQHVAL